MRTLEPSVSWQAVGGTHNRPILYALLIFGKSQGTYKQISHLESLLPCLEFWEYQEHVPFIRLPAGREKGRPMVPVETS